MERGYCMARVKFVTISELDQGVPAVVALAEGGKNQVVITKRGKPVALLRKISKKETGRKETLTSIANNANKFISEMEKNARPIVITRNGKPVLLLKPISDRAFSIG